MTDLELTTATALAMGYRVLYDKSLPGTTYLDVEDASGARKTMLWSPLVSDEQAMALIKKFGLRVDYDKAALNDKPTWYAQTFDYERIKWNKPAEANDLNRAVVKCVAKIQKEGDAASQGSTERKV